MQWEFSIEENNCNSHESVYCTPEYQTLWAKYDNARALVIQARSKTGIILTCPVLVRQLDNDYYEAYSAYGYGGFLGPDACHPPSGGLFSEEDFSKLMAFLKYSKIIAIFLRNTPYTRNEAFIPEQHLSFNRETVSVDLKKWEGDFPDDFKSAEKWSVRYARRSGVTAIVKTYDQITENDILGFMSLYSVTMTRNEARHYYRFPKRVFFDHLNLRERIELVELYKGRRMVGGAFFLIDRDLVNYHLSATDGHYVRYQLSDMLIHTAIIHYARQGKKYLHLGGGRTTAPDDSLLKFKKRYARIGHRYYVAGIVTDPDVYGHFRRKLKLDESRLFLIGDALAEPAR